MREEDKPILAGVALLALTRGRFRIKKSTRSRGGAILQLILSVTVSGEAQGVVDYLSNKLGGTLIHRAYGPRAFVVWQIHEQDVLRELIDHIIRMRDEDELELPDRMARDVAIAWSFLNTGMRRGRLTAQRKAENQEAMEERMRLYELMRRG